MSRRKGILLLLILYFMSGQSRAQHCDSKYFKLSLTSDAWQEFSKTSYTSSNDIIVTGISSKGNTNALLAKFTKNGILTL